MIQLVDDELVVGISLKPAFEHPNFSQALEQAFLQAVSQEFVLLGPWPIDEHVSGHEVDLNAIGIRNWLGSGDPELFSPLEFLSSELLVVKRLCKNVVTASAIPLFVEAGRLDEGDLGRRIELIELALRRRVPFVVIDIDGGLDISCGPQR